MTIFFHLGLDGMVYTEVKIGLLCKVACYTVHSYYGVMYDGLNMVMF